MLNSVLFVYKQIINMKQHQTRVHTMYFIIIKKWFDMIFSVYKSPWLLIISKFKLFNRIILIMVHE